MKIVFCGSNGTGKTTLLNRLREIEEFKDFTFIIETTRDIMKFAPINESGCDLTQQLVMSKELLNLYENKKFISDRGLYDGWIYTESLYEKDQVTLGMSRYAKSCCIDNIKKYDFIFYLPIEFELEDDGVRSNSNDWRREIDSLFQKYNSKMEDYGANIHQLNGTIEERVTQLLNIIRNVK